MSRQRMKQSHTRHPRLATVWPIFQRKSTAPRASESLNQIYYPAVSPSFNMAGIEMGQTNNLAHTRPNRIEFTVHQCVVRSP